MNRDDGLIVYEFQPLWMTLDQVGPFRSAPYEIDFTDAADRPCNIFLLMSENGRGKSTVLEFIALLMRLLEHEQPPRRFGHEDLDHGEGRVQLDVLTRVYWQGRDQRIVLSLVAGVIGEETFLKVWDAEALEKYGAQSWHQTGFRRRLPGRLEKIGRHDDKLMEDLLTTLWNSREAQPSDFAVSELSLPTALYFPAYRDIPSIVGIPGGDRPIVQPEEWNYRTLHEFESHSTHWTASLDNLLVWLKWLDNGSFEKARDMINRTIFNTTPDKFLKGIRRVPPEAVMVNGGSEHRLDRLSGGEKNFVQLFLRIGAHQTRNTWLLIDEMDVHLHPKWQTKILYLMEEQIQADSGFTLVLSCHSKEILEDFAIGLNDEQPVKGGWIIKEGL